MIQDLLDLLLHRWIWHGDKIRLYNRDWDIGANGSVEPRDELIGEFVARIEGGVVRVPEHHRYAVIRRDLPKWDELLQCWTYYYVEGHGS